MRQDRIVQLLVTNIKRPEKLGFSSGPKLIALINTFKSNKKRAHWMVQSCSHPLLSNLTPPWINSRQLELVLTNTLEHTQTNTHTHTHQLPQIVSRLVEDQDRPPVRKDFRTKLKTQTHSFFLKLSCIFRSVSLCSPGGRWRNKSIPSQVGQGSILLLIMSHFFKKTGWYFSKGNFH